MAKTRDRFGFGGDDRPEDNPPAEGDAPAGTTDAPAGATEGVQDDPPAEGDAPAAPIAPQRPGGATTPRPDEGPKGGKYKVGDQTVDADGNPIKG